MNSEFAPQKEPGPLSLRRYGCLIILVGLVMLIIAAVFALRYMVVGSAVPFRVVASMVESVSPTVKITGISGNISTGPSVESITWGDDPAKPSQILDLRIKYNGYADANATKRVVISDVGVRKAHIDLADFGEIKGSTHSNTGVTPAGEMRSATGSLVTDLGLESLEIQQVLIEDVLITNRNSPFRLSIPKVSWTGFKMTKDAVEAGELTVDSDRLTLRTQPGRTLPMGSESVTFQKTLVGTVQPLMHPSILQPISFMLDYTFVPEVKTPAYHFSTADAKVEMATTADGGQALHVRHLDLGAYLDARKLYGEEASDLPSDLVLEAAADAEGGPFKIVSGSFRLGVQTFQIEPRQVAADALGKGHLDAVLRTGAGEIRWSLPLEFWPGVFRPVFSSNPELPLQEILARVFAGKKYAELDAEEKRAMDRRIPIYFSTPAP